MNNFPLSLLVICLK